MHLIFCMAADGAAYPAHPGPERGVVGGAVVGPHGLVAALAGQLGLSGPPVAPVVRIAAWQARLEAAAARAPRFYSASLSADPWAAARLLLSWRDDLVEAGWASGSAEGHGARIADLGDAERAPLPALPRGRADVFGDVVRSLQAGASLDLDVVEMVDEPDLLPPAWRRLLDLVAAAGVTVRSLPTVVAVAGGDDLGRLRRLLASGDVEPLVGDGSVVLLEASTSLMLAEAAADWVARDAEAGRGTVVVVPDGDGSLLDLALARRDLPVLGRSPRSRHRGPLQVLASAFAVAWQPFDPRALVDLLLLPRSPIPAWAARVLAEALTREPGVGGSEWRRAWGEIELDLPKHAGKTVDAAATLADWRSWAAAGRHDRSAGMDVGSAVSICDRVRAWATAADAGARDPLLVCAAEAADDLARALDSLGRPTVSATQLGCMVDVALGEGLADPAAVAEEGGLRSVTDPGAVWAACDRVLWWNFAGARVGARARPWTEAEAASLALAGCPLETVSLASEREASASARAILFAREAVVLALPPPDRGSERATHPLAHRLAPLLDGAGSGSVRFVAEDLLAHASSRIGDREVLRLPAAWVPLPTAQARWDLPASLAMSVLGRSESATSLGDLVHCQLRWLLRHVALLRTGGVGAIPDSDRLLGNLAHAAALLAFEPGRPPDPERVRHRASAGLDALVDRLAAPLRLAGQGGDLAFARERIPSSLATLAEMLSRRGLTVAGLEVERRATVGPLLLRSRIDMVVRDRAGGRAVIDLKWTRHPARRMRELADGLAVQLATYGRLVEPGDDAPAAYYLLRQRVMLAAPGSGLAEAELPVARDLRETWDAVASDATRLVALAASGSVVALGLPGADPHLPPGLVFEAVAKVCQFCEMAGICRAEGDR